MDVRRIGIMNLPPSGSLPFVKSMQIKVGGECTKKENMTTTKYNAKLTLTIVTLKYNVLELKIVSLKYYDDIVLDSIKDPTKYGTSKFYF